jgi:hypothetical protein
LQVETTAVLSTHYATVIGYGAVDGALKIALNVCCANEGVHYGVEHSQHGIACVVHDAASVLLDGFRNQVEVFAQLAMRRILVVTGKTRVPSDIGVEYRSQLARQSLDHRGTPNADLGTTVC